MHNKRPAKSKLLTTLYLSRSGVMAPLTLLLLCQVVGAAYSYSVGGISYLDAICSATSAETPDPPCVGASNPGASNTKRFCTIPTPGSVKREQFAMSRVNLGRTFSSDGTATSYLNRLSEDEHAAHVDAVGPETETETWVTLSTEIQETASQATTTTSTSASPLFTPRPPKEIPLQLVASLLRNGEKCSAAVFPTAVNGPMGSAQIRVAPLLLKTFHDPRADAPKLEATSLPLSMPRAQEPQKQKNMPTQLDSSIPGHPYSPRLIPSVPSSMPIAQEAKKQKNMPAQLDNLILGPIGFTPCSPQPIPSIPLSMPMEQKAKKQKTMPSQLDSSIPGPIGLFPYSARLVPSANAEIESCPSVSTILSGSTSSTCVNNNQQSSSISWSSRKLSTDEVSSSRNSGKRPLPDSESASTEAAIGSSAPVSADMSSFERKPVESGDKVFYPGSRITLHSPQQSSANAAPIQAPQPIASTSSLEAADAELVAVPLVSFFPSVGLEQRFSCGTSGRVLDGMSSKSSKSLSMYPLERERRIERKATASSQGPA